MTVKGGPDISRTVFLDRDGVINFDSENYILSWADFRFIPGSIRAIARLVDAGFRIIIISNQSAVGRKMITKDALLKIFSNMTRAIEAGGGRIDDIFFCPHTPEDNCDCRKPLPGLILRAAQKHGINLDRVWMVGDKPIDIACARNAGCGHAILLGDHTASTGGRDHIDRPDAVLPDLLTAAAWILSHADGAHPHDPSPAL